jgi:hypothetical protein
LVQISTDAAVAGVLSLANCLPDSSLAPARENLASLVKVSAERSSYTPFNMPRDNPME